MRIKSNTVAVALALVVFSPLSALPKSHSERIASITPTVSPASTAATSGKKAHTSRGVVQIEIDAPKGIVWDVLTDFQRYPSIFKRIKSCRVTKREGDTVFTETELKPQMFVSKLQQHAVNELALGPDQLTWHMLDGNFKSLDGHWELKPVGGDRTLAVYTLEVDAAGSGVPGPLVNIVLHAMQKEVTSALKKSAETIYIGQKQQKTRTSNAQQTSGDNG